MEINETAIIRIYFDCGNHRITDDCGILSNEDEIRDQLFAILQGWC